MPRQPSAKTAQRSQQEKETGTKGIEDKFSLPKEENHERTLIFPHKSVPSKAIMVGILLWLFQ